MLKPFATKLDDSILQKLDELSVKTQIPKARLCKQAMELLFSHYERVEQNLELAERIRSQELLVGAGLSKN